MKLNTNYRTESPEIMDNFDLDGDELLGALDKIAQINRLLGGNRLTLNGLKKLIRHIPKEQEIIIIDLGCGNGDMLRSLSVYSQKEHLNFKLIGIDANPFTVNYAKKSSLSHPNIEYITADIFETKFENLTFDIALCTLTLHHFKDQEIARLLQKLEENATVGIVINDLHRSKIAYRLFQLITTVFSLNKMSKNDGLVSILRGFKKEELHFFSQELRKSSSLIQWKWAFRYQWIITKL